MVIYSIITFLILIGLVAFQWFYRWVFIPNVQLINEQAQYIYLPNDVNFDEAFELIKREKILRNTKSFKAIAQIMDYNVKVKPGRYKVEPGMNNYQLITMLRAGRQAPINLTIHEIRTKEKLAQIVSQKLIADSTEIINLLTNDKQLNSLGFNQATILAMFIPNTYQLYWNTNAPQFLERMKHEYDSFWNQSRMAKAKELGLTQLEVSILASIVDEESVKNDEKDDIAGLYLNRIKRGIPLQADPTIKFALGNFAINRILTADLEVDSPYNTYKHAGLPPGPIRMPSIAGIDAVLNPSKHDYLYMCAKEDFSGYHNFAKTLDQHNRNAARYRNALKERNIWR